LISDQRGKLCHERLERASIMAGIFFYEKNNWALGDTPLEHVTGVYEQPWIPLAYWY